MRGLRAALYKDLKLFFTGAGALALILPFLLLLALRAGMGDLSKGAYVQPFPIGVRDLDNTIMSRSLLSQMGEIELFSRIIRLEEGEPDSAALEQGAAAVVTVPKDFFFDLYSMEDCPVDLTLNGETPLEASLFEGIFTSVMEIIRADQAAGAGLYRFCYGELTPELEQELYAGTSEQLIFDALGRQTVFDTGAGRADVQGGLERRLLACALSVLAMFSALAAVKTLPEELALGVLPRFRGVGGSAAAFALSKLLTAGLLALPTLALALAVFQPPQPEAVILLALLLLAGAFGLLLALAAWAGSAGAAQRWGNLFLLASLVLGGTLWPRHLLPAPLPALGKLTLPYYAALGLEGARAGLSAGQLLALVWPLALMGLAGGALALPGLGRRRGQDREEAAGREAAPALQAGEAGSTGRVSRLADMAVVKFRAMAGGRAGLAALLAVGLLCGMAAQSNRTGGAGALALGLCDLDGSPLSRELAAALEGRAGLEVIPFSRAEEGERALLLGEMEGLLVIGPGYASALEGEGRTPLSYTGAASALSAQGARELVAGQVSAQRARLRAANEAGERLGRPLNEGERAALMEEIDRVEAEMPPLFHVSTAGGAVPAEPFAPSPMGFAALAALFTLFTAAPWTGSGDGRRAERRLSGLPGGLVLSYGSDCLALAGLGLMTALAVLLPGGPGQLAMLPAAVGCAFTCAALALAVTRFSAQEGRVDGLAPFLALILCLLGGCFLDVRQLSPGLAALALATPPGLALAAGEGSLAAWAGLVGEGVLFLLLGRPGRRG